MKRKALTPYIAVFLYAVMLYIFLPIMVFAFGIVKIATGSWVFILSVCAIPLYFNLTIGYFLPGVRVLLDIISDSFWECEIVHENSFVDEISFLLPVKEGGVHIREQILLKVFCLTKSGKITLSCSQYHGMEKGGKYTVIYGKYSKVIISILNQQNEELLNVPYYECEAIMSNEPEKRRKRRERKNKHRRDI